VTEAATSATSKILAPAFDAAAICILPTGSTQNPRGAAKNGIVNTVAGNAHTARPATRSSHCGVLGNPFDVAVDSQGNLTSGLPLQYSPQVTAGSNIINLFAAAPGL